MWRSTAVASILFAALASTSNADLVTNGGFETGDFSSWSTFGNLGYTEVNVTAAHSGQFGAMFGAIGSEGGIRQTLTADQNDTIHLSFWLQVDNGAPNSFYVSLDGQQLLSFTDAPGATFTEYSFDVTLANANPTLEFGFRHDPAWYRLDDVSAMSLVPLPTGAVMGFAGLAGVAGVARVRRRRQLSV